MYIIIHNNPPKRSKKIDGSKLETKKILLDLNPGKELLTFSALEPGPKAALKPKGPKDVRLQDSKDHQQHERGDVGHGLDFAMANCWSCVQQGS